MDTNGTSVTMNDDFLAKWREVQAEHEKQHARVCPSCGHCPTCGRGGYGTAPSYPQPYYPWWQNPWYGSGGSGVTGQVFLTGLTTRTEC